MMKITQSHPQGQYILQKINIPKYQNKSLLIGCSSPKKNNNLIKMQWEVSGIRFILINVKNL